MFARSVDNFCAPDPTTFQSPSKRAMRVRISSVVPILLSLGLAFSSAGAVHVDGRYQRRNVIVGTNGVAVRPDTDSGASSRPVKPTANSSTSSTSNQSNSNQRLLPYQWGPPDTVPCSPKTDYCAGGSLSNAPYCTQRITATSSTTCPGLVAQYGPALDPWTLVGINPQLGDYPDCPGLYAGMRLCVMGAPGWQPDDPSWKNSPFPTQLGQTYTYCKQPGLKQLALTFDDGVSTNWEALLDTLKKYKVRATFFVNGWKQTCIYSNRSRTLLKRAYKEGHQIGLHTWSHPSMPGLLQTYGASAVYSEIDRISTAVGRILGRKPRWFRFPYGEGNFNSQLAPLLASRGLAVASWSLATLDANLDDNTGTVRPALVNQLTKRAFFDAFYGGLNYPPGHRSRIVLMHDFVNTTVKDLAPWLITTAKKMGYTFVTLGQCVGEPEKNWYQPGSVVEKEDASWTCQEDARRPRCRPWEEKCLAKPGAMVVGSP